LESVTVDGDVVVVPAQGREVGWFVVMAVGPEIDVVGLKSVSAVAAVDGATTVSEEDGVSDCRRNRPGRV
jgi:hypothetical protein